jgi:hypothetical protein
MGAFTMFLIIVPLLLKTYAIALSTGQKVAKVDRKGFYKR